MIIITISKAILIIECWNKQNEPMTEHDMLRFNLAIVFFYDFVQFKILIITCANSTTKIKIPSKNKILWKIKELELLLI